MKITYTLFLSLLLSTVLYAQKTIHLPNGVKDESLPINVSGIQIINAVGDSSLLGYVQTGMFNRWTEAVPDIELTPFLQSFVNRRYGSYFKSDAPQLVFIIQDLRINERTFTMSEKAFLHIKALAFIGNESFKMLTKLDTVFERGGMDVTHKHGDNIAAALHMLFKKAADFSPSGQEYSSAALVEKANELYQKPAFTSDKHEDGIYVTFEEYLNDQPSIKDVNSKATVNFWGVRKNGMLFKNYDDHLIPLEMKQRSIALTGYIPAARRKNNFMLLGATGGIVGSMIMDETYQLPVVTNIPTITKKTPQATTVDIETGEFTL